MSSLTQSVSSCCVAKWMNGSTYTRPHVQAEQSFHTLHQLIHMYIFFVSFSRSRLISETLNNKKLIFLRVFCVVFTKWARTLFVCWRNGCEVEWHIINLNINLHKILCCLLPFASRRKKANVHTAMTAILPLIDPSSIQSPRVFTTVCTLFCLFNAILKRIEIHN